MTLARNPVTLILVMGALTPTSYAAADTPLEGIQDLFDKGGWVMYIIVGLSVVGVACALERLVSLRKSRLVPANLKEAFDHARSSGETDALRARLEESSAPLARVLKAGLGRSSLGVAEMERAMEAQGGLEAAALQRPIRPIGVLAQVEPLLGLLGTILGMISTFNLLHTTSAAERVSRLAPGIGQALYTTAAGLAIAIPFVLIHHHLLGRVLRAAEEWSVMGNDLVALVSEPVSRNPERQSAPVAPEGEAEKAAQA